jgi:hypothetical protein
VTVDVSWSPPSDWVHHHHRRAHGRRTVCVIVGGFPDLSGETILARRPMRAIVSIICGAR